MSQTNPSRTVAAELTQGLTRDDLEALRKRAGLESLPDGSLSRALAEHGFSVEDMVTLLMAALVEKSNEAKAKDDELHSLRELCHSQEKAIDQIYDQTVRLKSLLTAICPGEADTGDVMAQLRALAESPTHRHI